MKKSPKENSKLHLYDLEIFFCKKSLKQETTKIIQILTAIIIALNRMAEICIKAKAFCQFASYISNKKTIRMRNDIALLAS